MLWGAPDTRMLMQRVSQAGRVWGGAVLDSVTQCLYLFRLNRDLSRLCLWLFWKLHCVRGLEEGVRSFGFMSVV